MPDIAEQLFEAIDAIVAERLRALKYDKTVVATVIDADKAAYGKYRVTTDDNITFYAYADTSQYTIQDKVYIRIPESDYTKQKIITGRYIPESNTTMLQDYSSRNIAEVLQEYQQKIDELTQSLNG